MRWLLRKLDSLGGTAVAALAGLAASQLPAFVNAYLQRLGGHIDEARRTVESLRDGPAATAMADPRAQEVVAALSGRLDGLEAARGAIEQAGAFTRPIVFLWHIDTRIAAAAARDFVPSLPLDLAGLVYTGIGIALGWLLWDLLRGLARALLGRLRRRREARRSAADMTTPGPGR